MSEPVSGQFDWKASGRPYYAGPPTRVMEELPGEIIADAYARVDEWAPLPYFLARPRPIVAAWPTRLWRWLKGER